MATKESKKVDLSEAASYKGKVYGPGKDVEVPGEFPDDTEARIAAKRERRGINPQSPPGASGSGVEQTEDVVNAKGNLMPRDPTTLSLPDTGSGASKGAYEEKNKDDLLAEAEKRKLDVKGSGANGNILKEDLVSALEEDDKAKGNG